MKIIMNATFACMPLASASVDIETTSVAEAHAAIGPLLAADTLLAPLRARLSREIISDLSARLEIFANLHLPLVAEGREKSATARCAVSRDCATSTLWENEAPRDAMIVCFSILSDADQPDGVIDEWIAVKGRHGVIIMGVAASDAKGRFAKGDPMHTSPVSTPVEEIVQGAIVQTMNSRYLLGKPAVAIAQDAAIEMLWLGCKPIGADA
jgi:hypothetical protein